MRELPENKAPQPPPTPIQPWDWPQRPWVRIHADYAGPIEGHMLLIVVDSHSKWIEVKNATSLATFSNDVCHPWIARDVSD